MVATAPNLSDRAKKLFAVSASYFGLVLVIVLFAVLTKGQILLGPNLRVVFNQLFPPLLCCLGATFYWAHGSLDISVSACMACAAIVAGNLLGSGHLAAALFAAVLIALVFALINGLLSTVCGLPAFLVTVCTFFIGNGIQSYFTLKNVVYIRTDLTFIDDVPIKIAVAVIAAAVCYVLFEYTQIGKNNVVIGGNIKAARFSGIRVHLDRIYAFLIAGALVGVAAYFQCARTLAVTNTFGAGMQFDVMIAMVFGGMIVGGGKNARISSGIVGTITYVFLANGLQIAGVPAAYVNIVKGVIFLLVVSISFRKQKSELLPN